MSHYINIDEKTFTIRIRYTGGHSWIGIGINTDDSNKMTPAYAVIGDVYHQPNVQRYKLISDDKTGSGVIPLLDNVLNNHLKLNDSSFIQTTTTNTNTNTMTESETQESVLEFTHDLIIRNENDPSIIEYEINESSVWIWAIGLPDNTWAGKVSF